MESKSSMGIPPEPNSVDAIFKHLKSTIVIYSKYAKFFSKKTDCITKGFGRKHCVSSLVSWKPVTNIFCNKKGEKNKVFPEGLHRCRG